MRRRVCGEWGLKGAWGASGARDLLRVWVEGVAVVPAGGDGPAQVASMAAARL